jgi:putative tryptophan/tyrosine transport system substrate-binding protein
LPIQCWPLSLGADMRRCEFIRLLGGATAAWPFAARAQQVERIRRIGVLMAVAENDLLAQPWVFALQERLEKLGWQAGRNLQIDYRWTAGNLERMRMSAAELVSLNPDVLLAGNTPTGAALQQATRGIPIVFVLVGDPVGDGFIASLAHPGGNMTGFIAIEPPIAGKQLELPKEIAPGVRRVAFLFNPVVGRYIFQWLRVAEASAPSLGMEIIAVPVHNAAEIESVITTWGREASGGLNVAPDITTIVNRHLIAALAVQHRLPAVYPYRFFVASGGLASYGTDIAEEYRQAAGYIDQILKGAQAGQLPVQTPTKCEMAINVKAATAIGLEIPAALLLRADEVIE